MTSPVASLFNNIAKHYDVLNHLLSFNIDKKWRRKALKNHISADTKFVLDIACGTGDFALQLIKNGVNRVVGVDISEEMIKVGQQKVLKRGLQSNISLQLGDSAGLEFDSDSFDVVTVAFGVRNFEKRAQSLNEMLRVLRPQGEVIILEFSTPTKFPIKQLYRLYFKQILPFVGGLISGHRDAYQYLPNTVYAFPQGEQFLAEMRQAGFTNLSYRKMSFGIASVYYGTKL
ncbi:MAG: bifunctional demethylmenaquinone methyltransferase/2-methoxy-6-polyprenyl-1,4-benzoquinol methylase UbiE [Prevotellaceae bacterium]|nr:bifunctional demethylmenaquinone methyltransferase/2-methoxy-6-polyprenyl-1,4-benzoquinol methylase UbiE [Prevotellaceae bacterium]